MSWGRPGVSDVPSPFTGPLPLIRGTQIGLNDPPVVGQIKADMLAGRFFYHETRVRVAGVLDTRGTYHVMVGHHRMAAAVEIFRERGDASYVRELLRWGLWDKVEEAPIDSRPLPGRFWRAAFRNWLGF